MNMVKINLKATATMGAFPLWTGSRLTVENHLNFIADFVRGES